MSIYDSSNKAPYMKTAPIRLLFQQTTAVHAAANRKVVKIDLLNLPKGTKGELFYPFSTPLAGKMIVTYNGYDILRDYLSFTLAEDYVPVDPTEQVVRAGVTASISYEAFESGHVVFMPLTLADTPSKPAECSEHKWATYVGFTEVFEYCTKCDVKKGRVV